MELTEEMIDQLKADLWAGCKISGKKTVWRTHYNYSKKVKEFYLYFPELFDNSVYFKPEIIFLFAKITDDFLFIGMNSIAEYSEVNNPFASNGLIYLQQIAETTKIIDKFRHLHLRKIAMTHHHFNKVKIKENSQSSFWQNIEKQTMKLKRKKRLLKIFKSEGVELVLTVIIMSLKIMIVKASGFLMPAQALSTTAKKNYIST